MISNALVENHTNHARFTLHPQLVSYLTCSAHTAPSLVNKHSLLSFLHLRLLCIPAVHVSLISTFFLYKHTSLYCTARSVGSSNWELNFWRSVLLHDARGQQDLPSLVFTISLSLSLSLVTRVGHGVRRQRCESRPLLIQPFETPRLMSSFKVHAYVPTALCCLSLSLTAWTIAGSVCS